MKMSTRKDEDNFQEGDLSSRWMCESHISVGEVICTRAESGADPSFIASVNLGTQSYLTHRTAGQWKYVCIADDHTDLLPDTSGCIAKEFLHALLPKSSSSLRMRMPVANSHSHNVAPHLPP